MCVAIDILPENDAPRAASVHRSLQVALGRTRAQRAPTPNACRCSLSTMTPRRERLAVRIISLETSFTMRSAEKTQRSGTGDIAGLPA